MLLFFKRCLFGAGGMMTVLPAFSQSDSVSIRATIAEVTVGTRAAARTAAKGTTATIDEHMAAMPGLTLVRRGSYAFEPAVNSMTTERLSTTIDGMKIFSACTDRMDPVTSYVESANLQTINVNMGLDGNPQASGSIGGSIDMRLRKSGFEAARARRAALSAGYDANGNATVAAADGSASGTRFYADAGFCRRHADNYRAGGDREVLYSQFTKINLFANAGWRPAEGQSIEAAFIFDRATDVGYPALNMDVGRAEALIGSLAYSRRMGWRLPALWETKIYHNALTHDMDDSHRPDVVISMDMPGRSHTSGAYTTVRATAGSHAVSLCADAYRSVLYADMTMYPPEGTPMFMLTWPDVLTRCGGLALNDVVSAGDGHSIRLSAKIDLMHRRIRSDEGLAALRIYFPGTARSRTGWQGRVAASYTREAGRWSLTAGAGLGNRFPTVTEACGYFINNTFDRYDYIGNPDLDNEWAAELKMQLRWRARRLWVEAGGDAFFFGNYIIGRPDERLSAMTLGAGGVKLTRNAGNARIGNASVRIVCDLTEAVRWETRAAVAAGVDDDGNRLPLIAPPTLHSELTATVGRWGAGACARPQPSAGAPPPTARRRPRAMRCGMRADGMPWAAAGGRPRCAPVSRTCSTPTIRPTATGTISPRKAATYMSI